MSRPELTRAATAPVTRSSALAPAPRGYAKDDNSAERGSHVTWQKMESHEIRQRQRREPVDNDDSSVTVGENLTPPSSDGLEDIEEEAGHAQPNVFAGFRQRLGKLRRPLSETKMKDSTAAKRKIEYDKIRHHMLEEDHVAGLPRLAALQDSNPSFCIFRKFGPVAARILIGKQIELDLLVTRLNELDKEDYENPETMHRLSSIDFFDGCDPEQKDLMEEIEVKLKDYWDLLLKYVDVRSLSPVDPRHHRSVYTWMIDNRPICEGEEDFILWVDDFIAARRVSGHGPPHESKLAEKLESFVAKEPRSGLRLLLHNLLTGKTGRSRTRDPRIHHYPSSGLDIFAKIVASSVAVGILLIPVFILFLFDLSRAKMAVIVGCFVLVFMVTMSVLVDVTPHDLFIGIAAYSAVLVALLSNLAQGTGPANSSRWTNVTAGY